MNISRKIIGILIFVIILLSISGCQIGQPGPGKTPQSQATDQLEEQKDPAKENDNQDSDEIGIIELDDTVSWNILEERVSLSELTKHGSQPIENSQEIGFSIRFPRSWTINSGVFYDDKNKKVAEVPPSVILKPGQEKDFLDYQPATEQGEELISSETIQINDYSGVKVITRIPTEAGIWYPHIYRLSDDEYGFTMVFYSEELNKADQELFDRIINTFSFQ